jgi:hypothetical protein
MNCNPDTHNVAKSYRGRVMMEDLRAPCKIQTWLLSNVAVHEGMGVEF